MTNSKTSKFVKNSMLQNFKFNVWNLYNIIEVSRSELSSVNLRASKFQILNFEVPNSECYRTKLGTSKCVSCTLWDFMTSAPIKRWISNLGFGV